MSDKEKLMGLLKKDNINITYEELDEVINIFANVEEFFIRCEEDNEPLLSFVNYNPRLSPAVDYDRHDYYYQALVGIIELKRNNLLIYLDYPLLILETDVSGNIEPDDMRFLCGHIKGILGVYKDYPESYRYYIRADSNNVIGNDLVYCKDLFTETSSIPECYRKIMEAYIRIFELYIKEWVRLDNQYGCEFNEFLDMTYFYFLENNILYREPESVLSFLDSFKNMHDIEAALEKLNLAGFNDICYTNDNIINYIDTLYHNSKRKIISIR